MQRWVIGVTAVLVGWASSAALTQKKVSTPEDLGTAMKAIGASFGVANRALTTNPGTLAGGLQGHGGERQHGWQIHPA